MGTTKIKQEKNLSFVNIINDFIRECNSSSVYLLSSMQSIINDINIKSELLDKFFADNNIDKKDNKINIPNHLLGVYKKNKKRLDEAFSTFILIPKSIFITIISNFDYFFSELIKSIIKSKEGLALLVDKKLALKEINFCSNFEEVKDIFINNQLEELMRKSHTEQIDWLEKNLKIKIKKTFSEWKNFILITEVRNILVHNGGIINNCFLTNLKKFGITAKGLKLNEDYELSPQFMFNSINCLIRFSLFLYSVLLSKIHKKQKQDFFYNINEVCFDYLCQKKFILAASILEQQLSFLERNEDVRMYFVVNLCIAYKFSKKAIFEDKFQKLIDEENWDVDSKFSFAKAILLNKFDEAKELMLINTEIDRNEYHSWPLFNEFRLTNQFKDAYKAIFKIDYDISINDFDINMEIKNMANIQREIESMENGNLETNKEV